jgi:single-strand DNA-binding protein
MLKAQVIGNLGNDPELRYDASGSPVLRFNVASNYRTKDQEGNWNDATLWVRVTVFGKRADTLNQYLRKGLKVYVDGRLEARPWTDSRGEIKAGLEVMANEVQFMSSRGDDGQQAPAPTTASATPGKAQGANFHDVADADALDNLPF